MVHMSVWTMVGHRRKVYCLVYLLAEPWAEMWALKKVLMSVPYSVLLSVVRSVYCLARLSVLLLVELRAERWAGHLARLTADQSAARKDDQKAAK